MDLITLIEAGATSPIILFFTALLLGGLHGLEPGHSKTMMAAFIIAVRGTPGQAALLGISAALSHTMIVWALSLLALLYGDSLIGERLEPWFMMGSGALVVVMAAWIFWRSRPHPHHDHNHGHDHGHPHDHAHPHDHPHDHTHPEADEPMDAHARAHAAQITAQFSGGTTTPWQTIVFGLTGGLIPCPAAITVLVLCLHLKKLSLGITLVAAFSIGLALTLVVVGVATALGMRFAARRTQHFSVWMARAPYLSSVLIGLIGLYMVWSGYAHSNL